MTSLEFIEKEIKNIKEFLSDSVDVVGKNTKDSNFWEQRLRHLLQIKSELEAWEVTKRELNPIVIERNCGMFGSRYALKCDYEDVIPLLDKEVESFKKALEVEE